MMHRRLAALCVHCRMQDCWGREMELACQDMGFLGEKREGKCLNVISIVDAIAVISVSHPGYLTLWCPHRRPSCLPVARSRACSRPLRVLRGDLPPSSVRSGCLWVGSAGGSGVLLR